MRIPYQGHSVCINKEKWNALSISGKLKCIASYCKEQSQYLYQRCKDYWLGWVIVHVQTIGGTGYDPEPVYEVTVWAGRKSKGQTFNTLSKDLCQYLVSSWEHNQEYHFSLSVEDGCISQNYTFNRYQKNHLIKQLKPILEQVWYYDIEKEEKAVRKSS